MEICINKVQCFTYGWKSGEQHKVVSLRCFWNVTSRSQYGHMCASKTEWAIASRQSEVDVTSSLCIKIFDEILSLGFSQSWGIPLWAIPLLDAWRFSLRPGKHTGIQEIIGDKMCSLHLLTQGSGPGGDRVNKRSRRLLMSHMKQLHRDSLTFNGEASCDDPWRILGLP